MGIGKRMRVPPDCVEPHSGNEEDQVRKVGTGRWVKDLVIFCLSYRLVLRIWLRWLQCIQVPAADSPCFESVQEDRDYCSLTNHDLYAGCEAQTLKKTLDRLLVY